MLDRHGLVRRARARHRAQGTPLSASAPNELWCADFKGEFKLGDGRDRYPLTVSDQASRYLLLCEALESTREAPVFDAFQQLFRERGLPLAIRTDNGVPFASPNGLYNLSRLSVWWLRLGIAMSASSPAIRSKMAATSACTDPQEGDHPPAGREHPPAAGQVRRLHPRVQCRTPARGARHEMSGGDLLGLHTPLSGLAELQYPWHDRDILVTACGRICMHRKKINVSGVLAGQKLGIKEVDEGIWLVSFMQYDLGYIDLEQRTLQPIDNPFGPRLSPMS